MNKTTRLGILLVITISLLISDKTNCDDGSSSGKQDDEEKPVFRSTQQDRYDPFIEMNKKGSDYHEKNNQEEDEEEISGEEIDQEDEQIDNINTKNKNINETKPAKRKIRKNSPTIVHNQYPYINSMDQMRPSYTTPYDYNPYTPSPSSSFDTTKSERRKSNQLVGSEKTMEQFLDRLLHESVYDRRIRPFYTDSKNSKPVVVSMNININTISGISEVNMEYIVDCYFRQQWHDPRLMYSNSSWKHVEDITLHYDLINKVWTPDAFFRNSKDAKSHMITVPNRLIRIFPEGKVLYSQRLTLRLECPMKLQKFPLDNQTCTINIGSYGYAMKDIKFVWQPENPVTISPKLEMPDFILTAHNNTVCQRKTATGSYACLEVTIDLQRDLSSYINDVYIPSSFIVSLSFISFFIDHKSAAARAPLGVTSVLTITTMSDGIRSQLPKVSYIKAIDVWMSTCLVFVFAALLEYAVVNVIARKQEIKKLVRSAQQKNAAKVAVNSKLPSPNSNEKVLVIGNRLANTNSYKKGENLDHLNHSHEALEKLIHPGLNHTNSIKKHPYSNNSLHVDSAVSISAVSQQSSPIVATTPQPATPAAPAGPPKDDAQMVDFVSSFLFPITFIIFNIIYWMIYLNMQVESSN